MNKEWLKDLKPCPFCGSKESLRISKRPEMATSETLWDVFCSRCAMDGPCHTEKIEAIKLWNDRKHVLEEVPTRPWLGLATTRELLMEIYARVELDNMLEYRTVDGDNYDRNKVDLNRNRAGIEGVRFESDRGIGKVVESE